MRLFNSGYACPPRGRPSGSGARGAINESHSSDLLPLQCSLVVEDHHFAMAAPDPGPAFVAGLTALIQQQIAAGGVAGVAAPAAPAPIRQRTLQPSTRTFALLSFGETSWLSGYAVQCYHKFESCFARDLPSHRHCRFRVHRSRVAGLSWVLGRQWLKPSRPGEP